MFGLYAAAEFCFAQKEREIQKLLQVHLRGGECGSYHRLELCVSIQTLPL